MAATRSQSLLKEAMMNETKEFLESRLENLKETIDDPNAKIGERIHALLLLLRSGNREEENLHVHAYSASSQLPESPDFNRPEPKPNYVIKATSDVTEASSPLPNHTIKRHQRISLEEIDERRLKGLCLFCEESETPDHYLCHKNLGILMIDCDEDQSCDDEELVETEVATELNGIEDLAVENEANAKVISAIVKEESITQFQVPVSSLEPSLRFHDASPDVCEDFKSFGGFDGLFDHQEAILQVSCVKARDVLLKKSADVTNNQVAHQLFDKMPSKEKCTKHLKGWRFKFKRRKPQRGKLRPAHKLIHRGDVMEDDHVYQEGLPLWLLVRFKFWKFKFINRKLQKMMREQGFANHLKLMYDKGEHDELFIMAKAVSMRFELGLMLGITESDADQGQQAEFEQIVMVNEWLLQTSFVSQQVMSNTKLKFSKRWWFKYKYVKESIQRLHIQLRYKSRLEFEEKFKSWRVFVRKPATWAVQRTWEKVTHDVDIIDAYYVLQDEVEEVVNHTPLYVVKWGKLKDPDALLLLLPGDESFQIKHKWLFKLLSLILEWEFLYDLLSSFHHLNHEDMVV